MDDPTSTPQDEFEASLQVVKIKKNLASRVFHALLAVAYFILLLLALISMSTFAATYNDVRENSIYGRKDSKGLIGDHGTCMLYGHHSCNLKYQDGDEIISEDYPCLSSGSTCDVSIGGQVIVMIVAAVLCVVAIIKAFAGFRVFSPFAIVELIAIGLTFLVSLITSGLITGGLDNTCQAFEDYFDIDTKHHVPCCVYFIPTNNEALNDSDEGDSRLIFFFEPINAAEITSWAATNLLFVAMVMYSIIVLFYIIRKVNRNRLTEYTPQEDENLPNVAEGTYSYKQ